MAQGSKASPAIPCVGAVIRDEVGRILVIRRGQEPARGAWSLPGGRVEAGETDAQAVVREVAEETGLIVAVGELVGRVDIPAPDGGVFDIRDYAAVAVGGELRPGDDATDVAWVDPALLVTWDTPPGFVETLTDWGILAPGDTSVRGDSAS